MGLTAANDIADSAYVASFAAALDTLITDFPELKEQLLQQDDQNNLTPAS